MLHVFGVLVAANVKTTPETTARSLLRGGGAGI
jgi:hypothetical protein